MSIVNTVQARIAELDTEMATIRDAAEKDQRLLTADEADKLEKGQTEHADLTRQAKLLNGVSAASKVSSEPVRTAARPALSITQPKAWNHMGSWLSDVMQAGVGNSDARQKLMNAASTYGSEGASGDGGYSVPNDLRRDIQSYVLGPNSLLPLVDQYNTFSNTLVFPQDVQQPFDARYSGSWLAEAGAYNEAKPTLGQVSVTVGKLGTIVNVTNELMEDSVAMGAFVGRKIGERLTNLVNAAILSGAGTNNGPYGMLLAGCKKVVAKESGQPASTLYANNVLKMYYGMAAQDRANGVWIISDSAEPYLATLMYSGSTGPSNIYSRPGDFTNGQWSQPATVLGRPVITSPLLAAFSSEADIMFVNPKQYLAVTKGGVGTDVTPFLYWNQDIQSFKGYIRIGGKSWLASAVTLPDSTTRSPVVVLGAR